MKIYMGTVWGTIWELYGNYLGTVKTHGILASELPRRSPERPPALPAPPKRSQTPPGARERRSRADRARAGAGDDDDCEDDREDARGPRASATAARQSPQEFHSYQMCSTRALDGPSGHLPTRARRHLHLPAHARAPTATAHRRNRPTHPPTTATTPRCVTPHHTRAHARAHHHHRHARTHAPTTKPPWCHTTSHHITRARTHMPPPPRTHARTHTHARIHARAAATTTTPPPPREHSTPLSCEARPLSESQVRSDTRPRIEKQQRHGKGWEGGV